MNRTSLYVVLGMVLSIAFGLLTDGLVHALGHMPINGVLTLLVSVGLGFFVATIIVQPAKKQ